MILFNVRHFNGMSYAYPVSINFKRRQRLASVQEEDWMPSVQEEDWMPYVMNSPFWMVNPSSPVPRPMDPMHLQVRPHARMGKRFSVDAHIMIFRASLARSP